MKNVKYIISTLFFCLIFSSFTLNSISVEAVNSNVEQKEYESKNVKQLFKSFYKSTGVYEFLNPVEGKLGPDKLKPMSIFSQSIGRIIMILICILLFYLAIAKNFEPLLLLPIGFGGLLANIPIAEIAGPNGLM